MPKTKPKALGTEWETDVVRMSGYHGHYRRSGEKREYIF
mgnify:CR=1 FL=1